MSASASASTARARRPDRAGEYDVIIVGGGPVGLGLAIELGQRGVSCALFERYDVPQPIPRGQNLTGRTMEHMHFWGVEAAVRAARTIPAEYGIGGVTAYGSLLGEYAYDWLQREAVRPYYLTGNERLPQYATEAVLRERVSRLPAVRATYGWRVEAVGQDDSGATVEARCIRTGAQQTLRATYVVGCDGARSRVRSSAAIAQTRSDHDRLMVLLVFRSPELHELLARFPGKSYFSVISPELRGYWKFLGRVDLAGTFFLHAPVPAGTTADNYDFHGLLAGAVGAPFAADFTHVGFWDLRFAVADTYRAGRIFIAGDAAHSHPPYGGYGINTGFEDARNLGWKLAAQLEGWGGDALLDSYSAERQPVFASTAADFIEKSIATDRDFLAACDPQRDRATFEMKWNERRLAAPAEVAAFEPHYEGSPIVCGPSGGRCSAVGSHSLVARPGHHLAPLPLSSGDATLSRVGAGFALFGFDAPTASLDAFAGIARGLGLPLTIVADRLGPERAAYAARLILVRPDGFVAWCAASTADGVDPGGSWTDLADFTLRRATGYGQGSDS